MNGMLEALKKLFGPGMTAGFNPNEPNPIKTKKPGDVLPNIGEMINSQTPRAPMDAVDGRANIQANLPEAMGGMATRPRIANVPEGLSGLNFQVNPNYQTVSAPEVVNNRGKVKMSETDNTPFNPRDYRLDPEGKDQRDYFIKKTQKSGWKEALKPFLAGAVLGGSQAARNPNASGWDILGSMGVGAATGGAINKFDPEGGAAIEYEAFRAPRFRAQREREQVEENRQFGRQRQDAELGRVRSASDLNVARQQSEEERKRLEWNKFFHTIWQSQEANAQRNNDRQYQRQQDALKQRNWETEFQAKRQEYKPTEGELNDKAEKDRLLSQGGKTIEDIARDSVLGDPEGIYRYMSPNAARILKGEKKPPEPPQRTGDDLKDRMAENQYADALKTFQDEKAKAETEMTAAQQKLYEEKLAGARANAGKYSTLHRATERDSNRRPPAPSRRTIDASRYQLP